MKKLSCIFLILCLTLGTITMSSCNILTLLSEGVLDLPDVPDDGDVAPPDVDSPSGDIYVEGGDTNNVTINVGESSNTIAASKAVLSVVSLAAEFERTYTSGWRQYTESFAQYGSGIIYKLDKEKGDAYIITNYHVIHSASDNSDTKIARSISLFLYGMEYADYKIDAEFVGGSLEYDLAVLKVSGSPIIMGSNATEATVADSNKVSILETAIAIGNPDATGISATLGYVSVDSETISLLGSDEQTTINIRVMRIDTAINGGNSGGGLFNGKGELIGIVNAKKTTSDGMGYAIPSNVAKYIADNILYHCDGTSKTSVQRVLLGVTVTASDVYTVFDAESGKVLRHETVVVNDFTSTSIATDALKVGDVITSIKIGDVTYDVSRTFHLIDAMLNARVGNTVELGIVRDGTEMTASIKITEAALTQVK